MIAHNKQKQMTLLQRIASYATILNLLFNALTYFGIKPENGYTPINQKDPPVPTQRQASKESTRSYTL